MGPCGAGGSVGPCGAGGSVRPCGAGGSVGPCGTGGSMGPCGPTGKPLGPRNLCDFRAFGSPFPDEPESIYIYVMWTACG